MNSHEGGRGIKPSKVNNNNYSETNSWRLPAAFFCPRIGSRSCLFQPVCSVCPHMEIESDGPLPLWGLFLSAFLSASLLPGGSEVLLYALAAGGQYPALLLLGVAGAGNTLGGMSSWAVGRLLAWRGPAAWPVQGRRRQHRLQALARVRRWGAPALLLSWLPVVGDPLCVAAGWLRVGFWPALCFIAAGKVLRYAVILEAVS